MHEKWCCRYLAKPPLPLDVPVGFQCSVWCLCEVLSTNRNGSLLTHPGTSIVEPPLISVEYLDNTRMCPESVPQTLHLGKGQAPSTEW